MDNDKELERQRERVQEPHSYHYDYSCSCTFKEVFTNDGGMYLEQILDPHCYEHGDGRELEREEARRDAEVERRLDARNTRDEQDWEAWVDRI
jgi:hypothetical protein